MSSALEKNWHEIPHNYLIAIAQIISGDINDTSAFDKFNGPILKSSIKSVYWIFLIQYAILSVAGIISNAAIIAYTMYHKLYKDVTHSFIVNLGLCHFIQCLIVLPVSLMVMIIQNWIFGQFMCFFLPMLQDIPLHVAMISHILIAWDRMRWLGDPMRGRLPAFVCCCATWLTGMIIVLPYPIYTMYVELGDYVPKLSGIGLCLVNLMDDMHEYMRGLFVLMYCGPAILLSYLYIRTSQELRPPDGPFAVMMFEHRARQRNSSTSSVERSNRTNLNRTYDLYNAELDVTREKRTQRNLGSMAATQVLCVCPLMILRLARMVMVETYENTKHFDFTYLMFVWIAFLPTIIFPCIYASEILPRNDKDRLRGYFRLSSKRSKKSNSRQESIENEDTTTTTIQTTATIIQNNYQDSVKLNKADNIQAKNLENAKMNAVNKRQKASQLSTRAKINLKSNIGKQSSTSTVGLHRNRSQFGRKLTASSIDNSCSNITSSTYCDNSNPTDGNCENSSIANNDYGKKWLNGVSSAMISTIPTIHNREASEFSDCGSFTPLGSSSTLERDMEIIDLLERERSMDIQEMMDRERRRGCGSLNSTGSERRRLPDLDKICKSPKLKLNPYNFEVSTHKDLQSTSANTNTTNLPDTEDEDVPEPYLPPSTAKFYSRRMNRKSSHHSSSSHRSKRDSIGSLSGDFIAGAFDELDPTQPLSKMSVIENRMRRTSGGRTHSISSSSGRSSFRSRDYSQPQQSHPELDFRENIFAELDVVFFLV